MFFLGLSEIVTPRVISEMDLNLHSLTLFWWSPIIATAGAALIFLIANIGARRQSKVSPRLSPYLLGSVFSGVTLALVGAAIAMFAYMSRNRRRAMWAHRLASGRTPWIFGRSFVVCLTLVGVDK